MRKSKYLHDPHGEGGCEAAGRRVFLIFFLDGGESLSFGLIKQA